MNEEMIVYATKEQIEELNKIDSSLFHRIIFTMNTFKEGYVVRIQGDSKQDILECIKKLNSLGIKFDA